MPERVEAFLDEQRARRGTAHCDADRRGRRLELLLPARARRRPVRAAPPAAAAAPAVGARHGARGAAAARARAARSIRLADDPSRSARTRACSASRSTSWTSSTGTSSRASCRAGLDEPRRARALGLDLVDTLVEIHAVDVTTPGAGRRSRARELSRAAGAALHAALGAQPDARAARRRRGRAAGSPRTCRSRCRRPSSTATTGSAT